MPNSPTDRRFVIPVLLLVAAGGVALACGGDGSTGPDPDPDPGPAPVASVEVTPASETLTAVGAQAMFDATARDSAGNAVSGASISWSSSDEAVATVDGSGTATAEGNGEATITASADGEEGTATVTVDQEVARLGLAPADTTVVVEDSVQFSAEPADRNGNAVADASVSWSSTDSSVVSVDGTGLAVAEGEGDASVVAASEGVEDTASVSVRAAIASLEVSPDSAGVAALDATTDFDAVALAADGDTITGLGFAWSSSDTAVAAVDGSGVATARGNGSTTITASTAGVSASATFTVDQEVSAVTVTPDSASVTVDDTTRYDAEAADANGNAVADADVAWSTTDTAVATVDGTGLVTGQSEGSAQVVAESSGQADSATVVVEAQASSSISAVSGGGQNGVTTRAFGESLVVEVTDGGGNPQSGVEVTWTVASGDADLSTGSTTTGSDGRASVDVDAGETTGPVTVEASAQGADGSPVAFDLDITTVLYEVGDNFFRDPTGRRNTSASANIAVGDTVLWEWIGNNSHSVLSGEGQGGNSGDGVPEGGSSLGSTTQASGTYTFVPEVGGTWEFYCGVHPSTMYGSTFTVSESSSSDVSAVSDPRQRDLEPGDVIRPEGSSIIFVYRGKEGGE